MNFSSGHYFSAKYNIYFKLTTWLFPQNENTFSGMTEIDIFLETSDRWTSFDIYILFNPNVERQGIAGDQSKAGGWEAVHPSVLCQKSVDSRHCGLLGEARISPSKMREI